MQPIRVSAFSTPISVVAAARQNPGPANHRQPQPQVDPRSPVRTDACASGAPEKHRMPLVSRRRASTWALATLVAAALPLAARRELSRAKADQTDASSVDRKISGASHRVNLSEDDWRQRLTPEQFRVLRKSGTEFPFSSALNAEKRKGTFACAACELPLFSSDTKFDSGTGWPSFFDTLPNAVSLHRTPADFFLSRVEVRCARCDGHLGHVFQDGPPPTGERYCMNGVALKFHSEQS